MTTVAAALAGLIAIGLICICATAWDARHEVPPDSLDAYLRDRGDE